MKLMITGGNAGLGLDIANHYNADSFSRSTGHDINDSNVRKELAKMSLDYNVFVNNAYSGFSQTELLHEVYNQWKDNGHHGVIINIGSYSTYNLRELWKPYAVRKSSLDLLSKQISKACVTGPLTFRNTLIRPGYLETKKKPVNVPGIDGYDIIKIIDFIYNTDFVIYEMTIEKKHNAKENYG